MLWLKSCPRCNGDLHAVSDIYGAYIGCLHCGLHLDLETEKLETPKANVQGNIPDRIKRSG